MLKGARWYIATIEFDEVQFHFADQPAWMREPFFSVASCVTLLDDTAYRERTLAMPACKNRRPSTNKQNLKAPMMPACGSASAPTLVSAFAFPVWRSIESSR